MKPSDSRDEESELIRRIRSGEVDLFQRVVEYYSPMIFALTHRFASRPADAEDLAQDIFLKAYDSLDRFKLGTDFRAWLYTLGINVCRDYARNVRRSVYPISGMENRQYEDGMSEAAPQDQELERSEFRDLLEWALDQLPSDYSTVFLMKYREGLRYKEISQITTDSVGALKVRVHRARTELQKLLSEKL